MAKSVASKNKSKIIGLDYDQIKLDQACKDNKYKNLKFKLCDKKYT